MPLWTQWGGTGAASYREVKVTTLTTLAEGPRGGGAAFSASRGGSACQCWHRLGDLSLAARQERHRSLSLMSWLGILMVNWKWQGMQSPAACTKVTHPSFKIVLLKTNCCLECLWPSQLPGSPSSSLQVSTQMPLFQGDYPDALIWKLIPPHFLPASIPELDSLSFFPTGFFPIAFIATSHAIYSACTWV